MNQLIHQDGRAMPLASVAVWEEKRERVLEAAQEIMGPFPGDEKRCPLAVEVAEEVDCGSYVRRLIAYASEPGNRARAYLLIPKRALDGQACSAVLCLHPTHAVLGSKTVVGLGDRPNRNYASELAARGFVTLAPSYPMLADYWPDVFGLGYESGTMKAIWDNVRAIDLLETLPYVKRGPVGAIGHSLGGHNAVYTAVFEPRIGVVVSSCGLDSYLDYKDGDLAGWTQDRYMPKLRAYAHRLWEIPFDFHDLIAALAPRPCFLAAPLRDSNFKWQSVDAVACAAARVYALYGASENLMVAHPDCEHDFPNAMREQAYCSVEKHL